MQTSTSFNTSFCISEIANVLGNSFLIIELIYKFLHLNLKKTIITKNIFLKHIFMHIVFR